MSERPAEAPKPAEQAAPDQAASVGEVATALYAKHRELAGAETAAKAELQTALTAETDAGDSPADIAIHTRTAEAGQAFRAAGTARAKNLQESHAHYKANEAAYVEDATAEAKAAEESN